MGGCVSIQISLDGCISCRGYRKYIVNLVGNIEALKEAIRMLVDRRDELLHETAIQEERGLKRLDKVQIWVRKVNNVERSACEVLNNELVEKGKLCLFGYCSTTFFSSYWYGRRVYDLLKKTKQLMFQRFDAVAEKAYTREAIYTRPLPTVIVGQESTLQKARKLLIEDRVGVLALYGLAGVGKTTILSQLYNEFSVTKTSPFDTLIWLVAAESVQIHRIQEDLAKVLSLYNEEWKRKSLPQKSMSLYTSLRNKRFFLVLDDLWDKLDLEAVGIPFPTTENGCRIVLTSRSVEVCRAMGADALLQVKLLDQDDAWELFQKNVGETPLQNPEISRLARRIVELCSGNPLSLQVAGASLARQTSVQAWDSAVDRLTRSSPIGSNNLQRMLEHSYDALVGNQVKLCFLFCAMFPEGQELRKEDLVELWIGEGIIDENHDQDRAKGRGYEIIRILLDKNFLNETGESRDKVVMHDLLRELALYLASSHPQENNGNFIVESYAQVGGLSTNKKWRDVSRMSLVGEDIKTLSGQLDRPKLKTLLLRDTKLETISPEYFHCLPLLLVLDLSSNKHLNIVPDAVSKLVSLRYLNLSSTGIKQLPHGLSKLTKLTYLNLEHTHMLKDISRISDLMSIQELRLCDSGFVVSFSLMEELQLLEHLELLTITLQDEEAVHHFLSSQKLVSCTQGLYLQYCAVLTSISITSLFSSLRCLDVQDSYIPEMKIGHSESRDEAIITVNASPSDAFFSNLNEVRLDGCNGLRELTWLLFAPNLTKLEVVQSKDIEEIISKEKASHLNYIVPFQKLEFIALEGMDKLRSIYWNPLPSPELRKIRVRSCPSLTKLPLNSESAKGCNLVISAEKEFLQRIEWEDEETKKRLFPS